MPGFAYGVSVMGSYAYVADWSGGLRVVDVSVPSGPREVGFWDSAVYARNVSVVGSYAYVVEYDAGLRVIDVSDPTNPREVAYYDTPGTAHDVSMAGAYAYVADGEADLRVIDLSPDLPEDTYRVGLDGTDDANGAIFGLAGHVLDGDGDYVFPLPVDDFPSGDGRAGGDFVAELRITTRGEIHGRKWHDQDRDGVWDEGEPELAGWTIYLDENENRQLDHGEPSTMTDETGAYAFVDLAPGTYTVAEAPQDHWEQTYPPAPGVHTVSVEAGQIAHAIDFGNWEELPSISIPDSEEEEYMTSFSFMVTLSFASARTVTVEYETMDGTAEAGVDYVAQSGTLTFEPGERTQYVMVDVIPDTLVEPDETFFVNLRNPVAAQIGDARRARRADLRSAVEQRESSPERARVRGRPSGCRGRRGEQGREV